MLKCLAKWLFLSFCIIHISACSYIPKSVQSSLDSYNPFTQDKKEASVTPVKSPAIKRLTPTPVIKSTVQVEKVRTIHLISDADYNPKIFIEALYNARLKLSSYNAITASDALVYAWNQTNQTTSPADANETLLEIKFAKKGFAPVTSYILLNQPNYRNQLIELNKNLSDNGQELLSADLVKPRNTILSPAVKTSIQQAIQALDTIELEGLDYAINASDQKIKEIYELWNVSPYTKDIEFETRFYLDSTDIFLSNKNYNAAVISFEKAQKSYARSRKIADYSQKNHSFVSYYKIKTATLNDSLKSKRTLFNYFF